VSGVFGIVKALIGALLAATKPRASLVAENLALRQQLAVFRRVTPRPQPIDRAVWEPALADLNVRLSPALRM